MPNPTTLANAGLPVTDNVVLDAASAAAFEVKRTPEALANGTAASCHGPGINAAVTTDTSHIVDAVFTISRTLNISLLTDCLGSIKVGGGRLFLNYIIQYILYF